MKILLLILCFVALLFSVGVEAKIHPSQLKNALRAPEVRKEVEFAFKVLKNMKYYQAKHPFDDNSLMCSLCGIAMNEVEGFIAENLTESEMQKILTQDFCDNLSDFLKTGCLLFVSQLPLIINKFENAWSVSTICVDLNFCKVPLNEPSDPQDMPVYNIDLDAPPLLRWQEVCSNQTMIAGAQFLYQTVIALLPNHGVYINDIGEAINAIITPEYALEIQGCASIMQVPYGWMTLFNLGYEVTDDCTSIVAQTPDGKIIHGRNMDFGAGIGLTGQLRNMTFLANYVKGGKTVFTAVGFAGYVGILSGMKPGAFSITIDTRFYPEGITEIFYEIVAAIMERNASLVSFLTREVFMNENDFEAALTNLANTELIADVYYIMAGVKSSQGVVITRNRENASDIWRLDPSQGRWYEVETNYDHWEDAPWYDDRVTPANNAMDNIGPKAISLDTLWTVLSTKPVLNMQTTYSILSCPADSIFKAKVRYCQYPCAQ